jgi:hypothetical protein
MDGSLTLKHFGVDTFSGILPFALLGFLLEGTVLLVFVTCPTRQILRLRY